MSNIAQFNPTQLPSFARTGELSDVAKSLAGAGASSVKRISIKGGVFRLVAGGKEVASIDDRHLDVVIVNAAPKVNRTFYAGQYAEGEAKAPDCWSVDGERPDATASNPQSASCATCPQNIRGSGQGDSRACRFSQRLAVVLANDIQGGDVMQLTLAATSIFGKDEGDAKRPLQAYARFLAAQNISPEMVVTRLKFDTKAAVPKLFFAAQRWLTDEEYTAATAKGQTEDAKRAITLTVSQADGVQSKPVSLPGNRPTAVKEAVVEEPVEQVVEQAADEVDEPEKRKSAKTAKPAAAKKAGSLADVVADWDADDE